MSLATIQFLRQQGAKVIVISKIGRPKGWDNSETLFPAAKRVADLLSLKLVSSDDSLPEYHGVPHFVFFTGDIRKKENRELLKRSPVHDIILLENIRFYDEEAQCDRGFGKLLAELGDMYVNDAFAVSHRSETSVTLLPELLQAYAGLNLEKEITAMQKVLQLKANPFVLIMGGIKISDKIAALKNLGASADSILIGGGLANLFFAARGYEIGKSKVELEKIGLAEEILRNYKSKLVLPVDVVVSREDYSGVRVCKPTEVKKDEAIYDIGPKTVLEFSKDIKSAKKMVWNGPLGVSKVKSFANGTMSIALLFASKCDKDCFGLIGGGDTLQAVSEAKVIEQISFVSTGGGAMLEYLGGDQLPGIKALN